MDIICNSAVSGRDGAGSGNELDALDYPNREPSGTRSLVKVSEGQAPIIKELAFSWCTLTPFPARTFPELRTNFYREFCKSKDFAHFSACFSPLFGWRVRLPIYNKLTTTCQHPGNYIWDRHGQTYGTNSWSAPVPALSPVSNSLSGCVDYGL